MDFLSIAPRQAARGAWSVPAGRVLRLRPREAAWLRAGHGQLWVTFERRVQGGPRDSGDYFLWPGERIAVGAGETVVIGSAGSRVAEASFDWEPATLPRAAARPGWRERLLQIWAGFGLGLAHA
jgi:hypothetical protein